MCGIFGLLSSCADISPAAVAAIAQVLRHRGPDDEGFLAVDLNTQPWSVTSLRGPESTAGEGAQLQDFRGSSRLYLGHRRLAILDLSPSGHQPMRYGEHHWIVFNGEVYNYLELREELVAAGHVFRSTSDTEVILAAYTHWGENCVTRFIGDWAFCILDTERRVLFLSRDRFGVKPLFYFHSEGRFAFASELKGLLRSPGVPCELDERVAGDYLSLSTLDHGEATFFRGICRLLPAHSLRVDLIKGSVETWPYYQLRYNDSLGSFDEAEARFHAGRVRELLTDAVRIRLRADVPLGTCVSGGLDSSAVAALASQLAREAGGRQELFTACFSGEAIDEERYARQVVKHTGARGHFVYPTADGCVRELPDVVDHQDEPFGGASLCAQWEVLLEASKHVKVVLDGQGGDEVFGGYRNQRLAYLAQLWTARRFSLLLREAVSIAQKSGSLRAAVAELKALPLFLLPTRWMALLYTSRSRREMRDSVLLGVNAPPSVEHMQRLFSKNINEQLFYDMTVSTLPHLLRFEDRNSMAHSIEARVPFTDHRLVDYVFGLAACYKVHNGWTKYVLRLAVEDILPPEIVWRTTKLGFSAPPWVSRSEIWNRWARSHPFVARTVSSAS
jgi:asparagine synthase (glutamine-hydrolysing)